MTTKRGARLSPQEIALKQATEQAIDAAGKQPFLERELGYSQSNWSEWKSTDTYRFMPINVVQKVEALGAGSPGHPHITRALARAAGVPVSGTLIRDEDTDNLADRTARLTREFADVLRELAREDQSLPCQKVAIRRRADLKRELGELIDEAQQYCAGLDTG